MPNNPNPSSPEKGGQGEPSKPVPEVFVQQIEPSKQTEEPEQPKKSTETPNCPPLPVIPPINIVYSPPPQEPTKDRVKWTDIAIVILTAGIVGAAILQTHIFNKQWSEMHSSGTQTDKIVAAAQKIQAALELSNANNADAVKKTLAQSQQAMDTSNDQSQKVLNANIDAAHLEQRAWIVLKGIEGKPQVGQPWEIRVWLTNVGKTPAKKYRVSCNVQAVKDESELIFKEFPYGSPNLMSPNELWDCHLPLMTKLTQDTLDQINRKRATIFVYGSVTYYDVFGNEYWLTYCRSMEPVENEWFPCKTHNDTGDGERPPD